ncbi:hypothetical protein V5799_009666 [Amblyomma americanum]|uniref:M13 family peptidase n=1 Tax=Amblyomma americanum TaxID=6943 RepID=A0AAQ4FA71_AMBAM
MLSDEVRVALLITAFVVFSLMFLGVVVLSSHYARLAALEERSKKALAAIYRRYEDPPLTYSEENPDECNSQVCRWNANYLFSRSYQPVNPCEDFYEHVCSAFESNLTHEQLPYAQFSITQLIKDINTFMKTFLKMKGSRRLSIQNNFLAQAMWVHGQCTTGHINMSDDEELSAWSRVLDTLQLGGWPYTKFDGDIVKVLARGDRILMLHTLFKVTIYGREGKISVPYIVLKAPATFLRRYVLWPKKYATSRYKDTIARAVKMYGKAFMGAGVAKQISLLEMTLEKLNYLGSTPGEFTVKRFSSIRQLPKSEHWEWLRYMQLLFADDGSIANSAIAILEDPVFFSRFQSVFSIPDYQSIIANYVGFKAMVMLSPLMPSDYMFLYDFVHEYSFPNVDRQVAVCTILLEKLYRYGVGIAAKLTLSREFANQYRRHRDDQFVSLFNETRSVLEELLVSGRSWFAAIDVKQARRRLDTMKMTFGACDNFVQYERYRQTPALALGSNDTVLGTVFTIFSYASTIYWDALRIRSETTKAYDNLYDVSVFDWDSEYQPTNNFAFITNAAVAFLTTISNRIPFQVYPVVLLHVVRTMLKALLHSNSIFDARLVPQTWWSEASVRAYENISECLQRQYEAETVAEVGSSIETGGKWTIKRLEEVFLDSAVLEPLYELYERALRRHKATRLFYQLPEAPVTSRQLFFYNYAAAFCEKGNNESRKLQHAMAITPRKWRVNVPMRNFVPFLNTFSCARPKPLDCDGDVWRTND